MWIDCESEKTIGTARCEVDRIESVKCERGGVRKHSFFVCKIVCWKSMWEIRVVCGKMPGSCGDD